MKRKLIMIVCCALMMGMATAGTVQAQRTPPGNSTIQSQGVSPQEMYQVCCVLAQRKVLDLGTAMAYLRTGRLAIGKVRAGEYWAEITGGPMITILIDDNI